MRAMHPASAAHADRTRPAASVTVRVSSGLSVDVLVLLACALRCLCRLQHHRCCLAWLSPVHSTARSLHSSRGSRSSSSCSSRPCGPFVRLAHSLERAAIAAAAAMQQATQADTHMQGSTATRMHAQVRDGKCIASGISSGSELAPAALSGSGSYSLRAQFVESIATATSSQSDPVDRLQCMLNGLISRHLIRPTDLQSLRWMDHARSTGNELRLGFDSDSSCASFVASVRYREGVEVKIGASRAEAVSAALGNVDAASPVSLGSSSSQATAVINGNERLQHDGVKIKTNEHSDGRSILQLEACSGASSQMTSANGVNGSSRAVPPFSFSSPATPSVRSRLVFPFRTPLEDGLVLDGDRLVPISSDSDDETAVSFRAVVTMPLPTTPCSPLEELQSIITRLVAANVLRRRSYSWLAPIADAFCSSGLLVAPAGFRRYVLQINPSAGWSMRGMLATAFRLHIQVKPWCEWYLVHARQQLASLADVCIHVIQHLGGDPPSASHDHHLRKCVFSHDVDRGNSLIRAAIRLQEDECERFRQVTHNMSNGGGSAQQHSTRSRSHDRSRDHRSGSQDRGNDREPRFRRRSPSFGRAHSGPRSRSPHAAAFRRSRSRSRPRPTDHRAHNESPGTSKGRSRSRPRSRPRSPNPRSPPRRRSSRSRTRSRSRSRDRDRGTRYRSPSQKRLNGHRSPDRRSWHHSRSRSRNRSVQREYASAGHRTSAVSAASTSFRSVAAAASSSFASPVAAAAAPYSLSSLSAAGLGLSWLYPAGAVCVGSDFSVGEVVSAAPTTELSPASLATQSLMIGLPCAYLTDSNGNAMSAANLAPWQLAADAHSCLQALRFSYHILDDRTPLLFVHRLSHRDQYGFDLRLFFRSEEACKLATARVEGRAQ